MIPENYRDLVKETFVTRPIRSAILIDDEFPRFDETLDEEKDFKTRYPQWERARRLYQLFGERHIVCDVENRLAQEKRSSHIERARKSDLVLLDYHLTPDPQETSHATLLVRALAESAHFNVVVLYTFHPDLSEVWRELAANLRGHWSTADVILENDDLDQWDTFEEDGLSPDVDDALFDEFVVSGKATLDRTQEYQALVAELAARGVGDTLAPKFVDVLLNKRGRDLTYAEGEVPALAVSGSHGVDRPCWLQAGNCFVAIVSKRSEGEHGLEHIFEQLYDSLEDWRPNLVQVLLSQIQNMLELDGLASSTQYLGSSNQQVAVAYSLLDAFASARSTNDAAAVKSAVAGTLDKLAEPLRHQITCDERLISTLKQFFEPLLGSEDWSQLPKPRAQRTRAVLQLAGIHLANRDDLDVHQAALALNSFLSSTPFDGPNVTTGTIFFNPADEEFFLCCTPACDMVSRPANADAQPWLASLGTSKCMVAVRLELKDEEKAEKKALREAEQGRHVFVLNPEGVTVKVLCVLPSNAYQPQWEFFFAEELGQVAFENDRYRFRARRIESSTDNEEGQGEPVVRVPVEFLAVAQLRPECSARFLQSVGQHLSRIGVDFVSFAGG